MDRNISLSALYWIAACLVLLGAQSAGAAKVTSLSYDVTGGTFDGEFLSGPIAGGKLTLTPAGKSYFVTTPDYGNFDDDFNWRLTLRAPGTIITTGPSGTTSYLPGETFFASDAGGLGLMDAGLTLTIIYPDVFYFIRGYVGTPYLYADLSFRSGGVTRQTFASYAGLGFVYDHPTFTPPNRGGFGAAVYDYSLNTYVHLFDHDFTIGNEVRTLLRFEADIDVKPGTQINAINPSGGGKVQVALLGSQTLDVTTVDAATLAFGPGGAGVSGSVQLKDVNGDDVGDLVASYPLPDAGIEEGAEEACLTGETTDDAFEGCDAIVTSAPMGKPSCGLGFELALLLPPLVWLRGRARARRA